MNSKKVYIIVLNWNGTKDTIACLSTLKKIINCKFQIVLVDNGSETRNKAELLLWCKSQFQNFVEYDRNTAESGGNTDIEVSTFSNDYSKNLLLIDNNENLGFAAGNNVALRYVLSNDKNAMALLLNNDTEVEPDFLEKLLQFSQKKPDYVAFTPQIRFFEPKSIVWNCGGKITWFGNRIYFFANQHMDTVPKGGFQDITFITGCALLFYPSKTGILTEKYFFGEEDFEFSLRLKKEHKQLACVYESIVFHKVGSSISFEKKQKLNRAILHYVQRIMDIKDYYKGLIGSIIIFINLLLCFRILKQKYHLSFKRSIKCCKQVLHYTSKYNGVSKEQFTKIMNSNF